MLLWILMLKSIFLRCSSRHRRRPKLATFQLIPLFYSIARTTSAGTRHVWGTLLHRLLPHYHQSRPRRTPLRLPLGALLRPGVTRLHPRLAGLPQPTNRRSSRHSCLPSRWHTRGALLRLLLPRLLRLRLLRLRRRPWALLASQPAPWRGRHRPHRRAIPSCRTPWWRPWGMFS
jgi:hypothetical protein